jgi:hypothetical protein
VKRIRLAALALALGLACVGCGDDPEPEFSPPETTSPAPTETETTSDPPEPEKLSPEETVRAWVDARNEAMASGDVSGLRSLSAPTCSSCEDQIDPIKQVHDAGGYFKTKGWRVKRSHLDSQSGSHATVSAALILEGGRTVPAQGAEPVDYPSEKRIAVFEMAKRRGTWTVTLIGFVR